MAEAKTKAEPMDVESWLAGLAPARRPEAQRLLVIFAEETGFAVQNWSGMAGFGRYDYRYDSGHAGSAFATGFAARKADLVIYVPPGFEGLAPLLKDLGAHRLGKSCLYLKRLDGVNEQVLRRLIRSGLDDLARRWPIFPV